MSGVIGGSGRSTDEGDFVVKRAQPDPAAARQRQVTIKFLATGNDILVVFQEA